MPRIVDLWATNFAQRVGGWLKSHFGYDNALASAIANYPQYSKQQLIAAIAQVQQGFSVGSELFNLPPDQALHREDFPVNPFLPEAYQYVVRIELFNPVSGIHSHKTLTVNADHNLSQSEIMDAASDAASTIIGTWGTPTLPAGSGAGQVASMSIIFASRRS